MFPVMEVKGIAAKGDPQGSIATTRNHLVLKAGLYAQKEKSLLSLCSILENPTFCFQVCQSKIRY